MSDKFTCGDCPYFERLPHPMFVGSLGDSKRDGKCAWSAVFLLSANPECPARTRERELEEALMEVKEVFKRMEWVDDIVTPKLHRQCAICQRTHKEGHNFDCRLPKTLKKIIKLLSEK